ncbi:MAG: hypothetical protein HKM22_01265 [Gammaproteobacteria bacterium]|nr:hypothetical protein [Gammaproteobacteria bacterium]
MSKKIPDFTDSQIWIVESTLAERFKEKIETQIIDSEIRLHPHDHELTPVSALYREAEDCIISLLCVQADHTRNSQQKSESSS